jgi:signal transduction histidine kinase
VVSRWLESWRRNRLFRKYVVPFVAVVLLALLTNGLLEIYFAYQENKSALAQIQREKAMAAALRIEGFVKEIERQMGWTTQPHLAVAGGIEQRRLDFVRLLRHVPPITEVAYLDVKGREQLRLSRLAMDVLGAGEDRASEPRFTETRTGKTWYGPVYFRKESEPYMALAVPHGTGGAVTTAEVNLKFIWDVVSQIRIGKFGHAYVVDAGGHLIAHPDISLVLKKTDLSGLPQVRAARTAPAPLTEGWDEGMIATSLDGRKSLVAHTVIAPLGWLVVVEQPLIEAFAPLRGSIFRTGLLMLLGVLVSVAASLVLARKMARPIQALHTGAARIGAGDLAHQIDVRTHDELEDLAGEFNRMTARLRESYATLEQRVEERTRELRETLDQQTATGEILSVISSSPTDIRPVMDAVVRSAATLCDAQNAQIFRVEDGQMRLVARWGPVKSSLEAGETRAITRASVSGRTIIDRITIHETDLQGVVQAEYGDIAPAIHREGIRTTVGVPLLREGTPIGSITAFRTDVRPFSDKQIALLQTFADQAVIAIENVRLFKELEARNSALTESLDQQTATSDILRVISESPSDVRPVLTAVAESASRLCGADNAQVWERAGDELRLAAAYGALASMYAIGDAVEISADRITGRAVLDRTVVHVHDLEATPDSEYRLSKRASSAGTPYRTALAMPLLREGRALGTIFIRRVDVRPFTGTQIDLLQTFADQAAIAIENVRLFRELETRNVELSEALDQQTATGEILRVISGSPTDVQPVFDAIAASAMRLCNGLHGAVFRYDGARLHFAAHSNFTPEALAAEQQLFPMAPTRGMGSGRAILDGVVVHVDDVRTDPDYAHPQLIEAIGFRSALWVPMLREGEPVGVIGVSRAMPGAFTDKQVALLRTFADQAVIAIENVRLFNETQQKTRELEAANRHKDEFLASMSHELRTPLNAVIGFSEVLLERMFGEINDKQEEYLNDILSSGRHLLSLINDILDLAKIEAGRMELDLEDFEVAQAIDNAVVLVRERATRKGLALETALAPGLGEIRGDQRKIKQVLLNLLSNAVKFTPEGGRVEVRAQRADGHVEVSVTDTGIGIAAEDQEAVFEEFRQVGTDYAKKHEGTGLGLTLSRKFVELHGGHIAVKSRPGEGSTFTFTLPVRAWQAS